MALDDFNNDEMIWYKRQSYVRCVGRLIRTTKVTDKGDARMLEVMVCEQIKRMMKSLYFAVMSSKSYEFFSCIFMSLVNFEITKSWNLVTFIDLILSVFTLQLMSRT